MNEWVGFGIVAGGVAVVALGVIALTGRRRPADNRLGIGGEGDSYNELVLGDMTTALGTAGGRRDQDQILPELIRAGFYRTSALTEYRAVRTALVLTPLFAAAAIALVVDRSEMVWVVLGGFILALIGFSAPRAYVGYLARRRTAEMERGLPVFADMLSLALMAGQSLLSGIARVAEQLRPTFPRMSYELDIVRKQSELLSLNVAFEQWAQRSQLPELKNLSAILNQSQKVGNDVTTVLMEFATNMRTTLRQRVDAQAQRASFWMLFPTLLCLWIPAAIILVGPMFLEFGKRRQDARDNNPNVTNPADTRRLLGREKSNKSLLQPLPQAQPADDGTGR